MGIETGKIIKARLKALGKTQGWLAANMTSKEKPHGLSNNAISKWVKTGNISREHVQQAADLLGISADQLLAGDPLLELAQDEDTTLDRLDAEEKELVDLFRATVKEARGIILSSARITPKIPARLLRRPNQE